MLLSHLTLLALRPNPLSFCILRRARLPEPRHLAAQCRRSTNVALALRQDFQEPLETPLPSFLLMHDKFRSIVCPRLSPRTFCSRSDGCGFVPR